jgi:hypothetical protein
MTPVQETPQIFSLALVLCVLASLVILLTAAYRLIRGRRASALRLLTGWGLGVVVYLTISVAVSLVRPARVIEQGQNWCFDDWCIAVERVRHIASPNETTVVLTTDVRIYNDARFPEAAKGFWVYLRDQDDHRYAPTPGAWSDVVGSRVPPHGFARTSIDFVVPRAVTQLGLVTNHGGVAPCGLLPSLLEIGQGGCLFHGPNMIRIQ